MLFFLCTDLRFVQETLLYLKLYFSSLSIFHSSLLPSLSYCSLFPRTRNLTSFTTISPSFNRLLFFSVIIVPAPITHLSGMFDPARIIAPAPTHTSFPITVGVVTKRLVFSAFIVDSILFITCSALWTITPGPNRVFSPIVIPPLALNQQLSL